MCPGPEHGYRGCDAIAEVAGSGGQRIGCFHPSLQLIGRPVGWHELGGPSSPDTETRPEDHAKTETQP